MRIGLHSDIHLEFSNGEFELSREYLDSLDVLILAGDIGLGTDGLYWAASLKTKCPILYLAGNHEYYGYSFNTLNEDLQKTADAIGIILLQNKEFKLNNITFVGGTLWTDYKLYPDLEVFAKFEAPKIMNDYTRIKNFNVELVEQEHYKTRKIIEDTLINNGKVVVVTHHAPHIKSIGDRYKGRAEDYINAYYASDLTELFSKYGPRLWLHGHTHDNSNYLLNCTEVYSNCRGYYLYEDMPDYNSNFVIQI